MRWGDFLTQASHRAKSHRDDRHPDGFRRNPHDVRLHMATVMPHCHCAGPRCLVPPVAAAIRVDGIKAAARFDPRTAAIPGLLRRPPTSHIIAFATISTASISIGTTWLLE